MSENTFRLPNHSRQTKTKVNVDLLGTFGTHLTTITNREFELNNILVETQKNTVRVVCDSKKKLLKL